ncbi:hypothetical protein CVT24_003908 [Panaeolus cyanescens]|uniref:G domain-containing protein n=1 Tax=Panaeolus cyanescens TaxID=181874 RepID=A0A409VVB0_9AGAR|nr:hypothetical protein CVT24_003908 [Panaeolus cyanescens]
MPYLLRFTGDVSVKPASQLRKPNVRILIMGPTGAGKSTFIEAMTGTGKKLDIAKDSLEGATQEVNAYELLNVSAVNEFDTQGDEPLTIYLVDSPGFSDPKIPEVTIINKIKDWLQTQDLYDVDHILYLCPVHPERMGGNKRKTIKMLYSLLSKDTHKTITIVTTMWDNVSLLNKTLEKAEKTFSELENVIWKEIVEGGGKMVRFYNNQQSALDIIKSALLRDSQYAPFGTHTATTAPDTPTAVALYEELLGKIESSKLAIQTNRDERRNLISESMGSPNKSVENILLINIKEEERNLRNFHAALKSFDPPPKKCKMVPSQLIYENLRDLYREAEEDEKEMKTRLKASTRSEEKEITKHLVEARKRLVKSSAKIVEFGFPPRDCELQVVPYRVLSFKNALRHSGQRFRNMFVKAPVRRER